jgi:hypothetical protein
MSARHEANMKRVDKELAKREKLREQRERAYNNEQKAIDRQIALLDAQGKSTDALEEKKIRGSINYQKEKLKELELEQYSLNFMIKSTGTIGEAYQGLFNENAKAIDEIRNNIEDSENQLKVNSAKNAKERAEQAKKDAKKIIDISNLATSLQIQNSQKELQVLIDNSNKKLEVIGSSQDQQFELFAKQK